MKPAARVDDTHKCDKHGGEKIIEGSPNVFTNNKPAARQGDHAKCKTGEKAVIKSGSSSVMINGKPAARQDDPTDHDGKITSGSSNVKIGSGGNLVNFGNKGTINIGGNGKEVNIGRAASTAADILNIGLGVSEFIAGIPLDETGVGEVMQAEGVDEIITGLSRKSVEKPDVVNPKLKNLVDDLYKGKNTKEPIGTGSTADAIRREKQTGKPVGGKFHEQKGQEYSKALEKWLQKNQNASQSDRKAAQSILDDLNDAGGNGE